MILDDLKFITQEFHDSLKKSQLKSGDVLVTRVVTDEMKCGIVPASLGQSNCANVILIRPKPELSPKFLSYLITSPVAQSYLLERRVGSAQQVVNTRVLKDWPVPKLPIEEQTRIVAVLDQAFAALDRAHAHAEANLADCRNLFAVAVSAVVKRKSNNQQRTLRLGSIVTRLTNGYVGPISDVYVESGIPYLLARQVRDNTLAFDGRTYVTQEFNDKHKKSKLKAGDVLLVQSGHIGHSAVVPVEHEGHNCHAMIVITPVEEIVSGTYLSALFNTPEMQDAFQNIRTGSTVPHLTCKMVKELMIELPPRHVQDEIVQEIENLKARIEIAKQRYKTDVADLANLRQSLLQKAFSGQLT